MESFLIPCSWGIPPPHPDMFFADHRSLRGVSVILISSHSLCVLSYVLIPVSHMYMYEGRDYSSDPSGEDRTAFDKLLAGITLFPSGTFVSDVAV